MIESSAQQTSNRSKKLFAIVLIVVVAGFGLQFLLENKIDKHGVYAIGTVQAAESTKNGYYIVVKYFHQKQAYLSTLSTKYGREVKGQPVFVKLLPNEPKSVKYIEGEQVPDCMKAITYKDSTWQKMPACP